MAAVGGAYFTAMCLRFIFRAVILVRQHAAFPLDLLWSVSSPTTVEFKASPADRVGCSDAKRVTCSR